MIVHTSMPRDTAESLGRDPQGGVTACSIASPAAEISREAMDFVFFISLSGIVT